MKDRVQDVLVAKAIVLWALALSSCCWWMMDHPRVATAVIISACLTTTAVVWLKIDGATDAWRRGYTTALRDMQEQDSNVKQLRR